VGYAVFAADTAIRVLADPTGEIEHWSEFDSGGHFTAHGRLRVFFAGLR
jgi:hypothetical protein